MNHSLIQKVRQGMGSRYKDKGMSPPHTHTPTIVHEKSHLESIWVLIGEEQEACVDLLRAPREKF